MLILIVILWEVEMSRFCVCVFLWAYFLVFGVCTIGYAQAPDSFAGTNVSLAPYRFQHDLLPIPTDIQSASGMCAVDNSNGNSIIMHDTKRCMMSADMGHAWHEVFHIAGIGNEIQFITVREFLPRRMFVGAHDGLYVVDLTAGTHNVIFISREYRAGTCLSFDVNPFDATEYFLGTERGMFVSHDAGVTWQRIADSKARWEVPMITFHPNREGVVFFYTDKRIWRMDRNIQSIEAVFADYVSSTESEDDVFEQETDAGDVSDAPETVQAMLVCSLDNDARIYVYSQRGFFVSEDTGKTWQRIEGLDVLDRGAYAIAVVSSYEGLLVLHRKGLWLYQTRYQPYLAKIMDVDIEEDGTLALLQGESKVVLSDSVELYSVGIGEEIRAQFQQAMLVNAPIGWMNNEVLQNIRQSVYDLPSVRALQKAALEYGRLTTRRMKGWEWRAKFRALVPTISLELDRSITNNIDLDRGSTNDPDVFLDGPDEKDTDYGVSVDWDLADLIWNSTETSIEIRERALVDQREEILREVTRLYFEYKRISMESAMIPETDPVVALGKAIRCEEIVAQLDGLTGGFVSKWQADTAF